jgi:hypothetical protein
MTLFLVKMTLLYINFKKKKKTYFFLGLNQRKTKRTVEMIEHICKINYQKRHYIKGTTVKMANIMKLFSKKCLTKATDKFHIQKLALKTLQ